MKEEKHVLSNKNDAADFRSVESQITHLELALALLERTAMSGDANLIGQMSALARETRDGVIGISTRVAHGTWASLVAPASLTKRTALSW